MNTDKVYAEAIKTKHVLKSTSAVITLLKSGAHG